MTRLRAMNSAMWRSDKRAAIDAGARLNPATRALQRSTEPDGADGAVQPRYPLLHSALFSALFALRQMPRPLTPLLNRRTPTSISITDITVALFFNSQVFQMVSLIVAASPAIT